MVMFKETDETKRYSYSKSEDRLLYWTEYVFTRKYPEINIQKFSPILNCFSQNN